MVFDSGYKHRLNVMGVRLLCYVVCVIFLASLSVAPGSARAGTVMLFRSAEYLSRNYQVQNFSGTLDLQPSQQNLPLSLNIYNGSHEAPSFKWFRLVIGGYTLATEKNLNGSEDGSIDVSGQIPGGSTQVSVEAGGVPGATLFWTLTTPRVTIQNISPRNVKAGDTVTITGSNFSSVANQNMVLFNNKPGAVISASPTSLTVTAPANMAGIDNVQVNVNNLISNTLEVTLSAKPVPELLSTDCWMAPPGGTITIRGRNFSSDAGQNQVYFGSVRAEIVSSSPTEITVVVPNWAYGNSQLNIPLTVVTGGVRSTNALAFDIGPSYHGAIPQIPPD